MATPKAKPCCILQVIEVLELTSPEKESHQAASVTYGDKFHKKTKSNKQAQWVDLHFEIPVSTDKENIPELIVRITTKKKGIGRKITLGFASIAIDGSHANKGLAMQDALLSLEIIDEQRGTPTGKIKLKFQISGCTLIPKTYKNGMGASCTGTLRGGAGGGLGGSKTQKSPAPPIFAYIKDKNVEALAEFLKTASPSEVNVTLPKSGNSPLHEACIEREEQLLNTLLSFNGIDVNLPNSDGNTPLHYFCEKWTSPDYLKSFNLFIEQGANVNATNTNGETPIFKAIFNNSIRALLMEALISNGANLHVVTDKKDKGGGGGGEGLLHYAVHLNRADLVRLILQHRPSLDVNKKGATPDELANQLNGSHSIKKYLQQVSELFKWLEENNLNDDIIKGIFVKNEITVPLLPDLNDSLLAEMGIPQLNRLKIIRACEKEKEAAKTREDITKMTGKEDLSEKAQSVLEVEFSGLENTGEEGILDGNNFEYTKHLGTGAAGVVYKGLYAGNVVAIKVLTTKSEEKEVEEFKKEFEILRTVRSSNVVRLIGVSMKPRLAMVMEYCARGSLYHAMKDPAAEIGWARGINICKETANGLNALHINTPQILHRDLKTLNLLVTHEWHIKLADFGLSRFDTAENMETMKQMRGTYQYLDPEVYNHGTFTAASDIYSMSIIFWEVAYRVITRSYAQPYSEFTNLKFDFQIIVQSSSNDLRPTIPSSCPQCFKELISDCWGPKQVGRPTMESITQRLNFIENEYNSHQQEWDALKQPS